MSHAGHIECHSSLRHELTTNHYKYTQRAIHVRVVGRFCGLDCRQRIGPEDDRLYTSLFHRKTVARNITGENNINNRKRIHFAAD